MRLALSLRAARAAVVLTMAVSLFAGIVQSTPTPLQLAATTTGDCNGNGTKDLSETLWINRDDDGDGSCNGVDPCPDEAVATCTLQAITAPADASNPSAPHLTYSGATHTLKGMARYLVGSTNQYMWDFGDGTTPTSWTAMTTTTAYNLQVSHVYSGAVGTRYTATLSVRNSTTPTLTASDTYLVEIAGSTTGSPAGMPATKAQADTKAAIALDSARWYLHTTMTRAQLVDASPGYRQQSGTWSGSALSFNVNCVSLDALLVGGSLPEGDYANDPYVEDVRRALNGMFSSSAAQAITSEPIGGITRNPDSNGNARGVRLGNNAEERISATCLTALAHTGSPNRIVTAGPTTTGGTSYTFVGKTYLEVAQEAVDWFAWAQNNTGLNRGTWGYSPNDLSTPEVNSRGLVPMALANAAAFGATVPAYTKSEHQFWITYDQNTTLTTLNGGFGYSGPTDAYVNVPQTAGELIGNLWIGNSPTGLPVSRGLGFMNRYWSQSNFSSGGAWNVNLGNSSAMFFDSQLMRALGLSTISNWNYTTNTTTSSPAPIDWAYGYTPGLAAQSQPGLYMNLLGRQTTIGSWSDTVGNDAMAGPPSTALGILILDGLSPLGAPALSATATHTVNGSNGWNTTASVNEVVTTTGAVTSVSCTDGTTTFPASGSGSTWIAAITGEGSHSLTCTATDGTNSASSAVDVVKIDSITPEVTGAASAPANAAGWNNTGVTVTWAATDAGSGVASTSGPTDVPEGADQYVYGSATDKAGNTGFGTYGPLDVDTTGPVVSVSTSGDPVTNADMAMFEFAANDNLSGVAKVIVQIDGEATDYEGAPSGTFGITSEGRHQVAVQAIDYAGNGGPQESFDVVIDRQAPIIKTMVSPSPRNGWFNATTTVEVICGDGTLADGSPGSGVTLCGIDPDGAVIAHYGEGRHTVRVTSKDAAGNAASQDLDVLVDESAPLIVGVPDRQANAAGWYDSPVAVNFACIDRLLADGTEGSGVESCNDPAFIGAGTEANVSGDATDVAGNTGHAAQVPVKVDAQAPTITALVNGSSSPSPWYSDDVTITFSCADDLSGVASCPDPVTIHGEGTNLSTTVAVRDVAGNVTPLTVAGINIDRSVPTVTATLSSQPNPQGWNDDVVTVHWSCADATLADGTSGSGVVDCPADVTVADGADQVFAATVHDAVGNDSLEATATVNQDTLLPELDATVVTQPNGAGWYRGNVTVAWHAFDELSGIQPTTRPGLSTIDGEGTALTASASTSDIAGNVRTATSPPVKIDRTAPATVAGLAGEGPGGWFDELPVEVGLSSVDGLSGVAKIAYDLDGVAGTIDGDAGTVAITREGRHTLTYAATDLAGNVEAIRTVVVNVDLGAPSIAATLNPAPIGAWNNTPVAVTLTCVDPQLADGATGSGVAVCSAGAGSTAVANADGSKSSTLAVPTDGRHTVAGLAADVAGNASALSVQANVDTVAPTIRPHTGRPVPPSGWFTAPVTAEYDCTDPALADHTAGSGVAFCPHPMLVGADGATHLDAGAADVAGNFAATGIDLKIDTQAPTVTYTVNGSPTIAPWYSGPVVVAFTCTDAASGSGVATCPAPVTLTREASNQSVVAEAADVAGNATPIDVAGINIDRTGPTAVGTTSSTANAAGWHNAPVTVAWTCTDPNLADDASDGSGVVDCPAARLLGEGADQVASASIADRAGNVGAPATVRASVDVTAPTITGGPTTPAGPSGWYRGDVTVAWTAADTLSGIDVAPLPTTVTGEGSALQATASVADKAGNLASATVGGIQIDRTAPATTVTGAPEDWTDHGVTLTLAAADALSGVATTRYRLDGAAPVDGTSVAITTDGRHAIEVWSVDQAGNVEPSHVLQVLVDASAPHVTYTMLPGVNAAGWANAAVALEFTCADTGAGLVACDGAGPATFAADGGSAVAKTTVSSEGAGQSRTVTARDRAGNTGSATATFGIDTTAPTVTGQAVGSPNGKGWYRTPVGVTFSCVDPAGANGTAGSGVVTCSSPATIGEGQAGSATGSATDRAGNTTSKAVGGINVDLTAPTLSFQATGTAGSAGWYTSSVRVSAVANDALSGIDAPTVPADVVLAADGVGQSVSGTVSDRAGNTGSGVLGGIKIDRVAPSVVVNKTVTPTAVTVAFVCTDGTSGVAAGSCPVTYTVTSSSPAKSFTVKDVAGNATTVTVDAINVDATPPVITFTGNKGTYTVADTVAITCSATDAGSGIRSSTCANVNAPAYTFGIGTEALTATAVDNAGNTATKSTTFTVTIGFESLCRLHVQFIEGSAKFQALKPNQRNSGDAIGNALCQLAENLDRANVNARTGLLNAYRTLVSVNVAQGWLTPAQGTTLQTLAGSL